MVGSLLQILVSPEGVCLGRYVYVRYPLSSLEGYISISQLFQSVLSGALKNPHLVLSHPTIALAVIAHGHSTNKDHLSSKFSPCRALLVIRMARKSFSFAEHIVVVF